MIDGYDKARELICKMEANLPIPTHPTGGFIRAMKVQGVKIARDQELPIRRVFYSRTSGSSPAIPWLRRFVPTRGNARGAWPRRVVLVNPPLSR